jgi:hypothetical protein
MAFPTIVFKLTNVVEMAGLRFPTVFRVLFNVPMMDDSKLKIEPASALPLYNQSVLVTSISKYIPGKGGQSTHEEKDIDDQDPSNGTRFLIRRTRGFSFSFDFLETTAESATLT